MCFKRYVTLLIAVFTVSACNLDPASISDVMSASFTPVSYSNSPPPRNAFSYGLQSGLKLAQAFTRTTENRPRYNKDGHTDPDTFTFIQNLSLQMEGKLDGVLLRYLPLSTKYKGKNIIDSFRLPGSPWQVIGVSNDIAIIADSIAKLHGNSRGAIDIYFPKDSSEALFTYSIYYCHDLSVQDIYSAMTSDGGYVIVSHGSLNKPVVKPSEGTYEYTRISYVCNAAIYDKAGDGYKYITKLR